MDFDSAGAEGKFSVQSKISELEDKNTELAAELKRLQQENHNLDARMTALVRLVHQRNAQLDDLRAGQAVSSVAKIELYRPIFNRGRKYLTIRLASLSQRVSLPAFLMSCNKQTASRRQKVKHYKSHNSMPAARV